MRRLLFILSILQFLSHPLFAQSDEKQLDKFNRLIGDKRAIVLQAAVDSFDQFLMSNYPESTNQAERVTSFLEQIAKHNSSAKTWVFDREMNAEIIESFESTGLRREIWLYGYETYKPKNDFSKVLPPPAAEETREEKDFGELSLDLIEEEIIPTENTDQVVQSRLGKKQEERIQNSLNPNGEGDYIFALLKYSPKESFVYEYAQILREENRIAPAIIANGFLYGAPDYEDSFVKRLLVTEFYYWLINSK